MSALTPNVCPRGSRILLRSGICAAPCEATILEWGPSGVFVKVEWAAGHIAWLEARDHQFVESLGPKMRHITIAKERP